MKAILIKEFGGTEQLYIGEYDTSVPNKDELLIKVKATALNRADILQRQGKYPPPQGASPIMGLEIAGVVEEIGENSKTFKAGDRILALLPSGGYAEYAAVPEGMAMPIPENLSFEEAAAIPEVFLTAFQALNWLGNIKSGNTVLIHAGASGVGTATIQLAKYFQSTSFVTAGSKEKLQFCRNLGASFAINYKEGPFVEKILDATNGNGVNIIIDFIGAPYWKQNVSCLALDGRIIMLATMGGSVVVNFDLRSLFKKRGQFITSTLRNRPLDYKIRLTKEFAQMILPEFTRGKLKAVVDKVFNWSDVAKAHQYMEENRNMGKIVLNGM
jgi:tumor protein p53-inducible protein 3